MRSAVLAGLAALAGCGDSSPREQVVRVDIKGPPPSELASPVSASATPAAKATDLRSSLSMVEGKAFQALGTEPFWSLEVLPGKLIYTSPETQDGVVIASRQTSQGSQHRFEGEMSGKPVILTIEPGECNDGMSDTTYSYKSSFTWGDRTEQGCARLK